MSTTRARAAKIAWSLAIVVAAASTGILVDWQAPGIGRYTRDWLVRARGPLPVPDEIAIVAIDESSMALFGRFPWSGQVIARTIDALAAARPKVIALDVLFTDPTPHHPPTQTTNTAGPPRSALRRRGRGPPTPAPPGAGGLGLFNFFVVFLGGG